MATQCCNDGNYRVHFVYFHRYHPRINRCWWFHIDSTSLSLPIPYTSYTSNVLFPIYCWKYKFHRQFHQNKGKMCKFPGNIILRNSLCYRCTFSSQSFTGPYTRSYSRDQPLSAYKINVNHDLICYIDARIFVAHDKKQENSIYPSST